MIKTKLGYFADGPWSHNALNKIELDDSFHISFFCLRYGSFDKFLYDYAKKNNIDVYVVQDINSKEFIDKISFYECDLFVSMSFDQIFKKDILKLPRGGVINCHAGMLPFYRGRNVLNWVLINDENSFGITVHYVDDGIDTGDIINQTSFDISDYDDYRSILSKAYVGCADVLYKSLKDIQAGSLSLIKQKDIHPYGFYCPKRILGDEIIDWSMSSREIFNFIRSICSPGPSARTFLNNKEVKINKSEFLSDAPVYKAIPGVILTKDSNGLLVKTGDSFIRVVEYEYDGSLKVGDRFSKDIFYGE